jgi:glycosyltransferase involved in cell wall biosynthesis
MKHAVAVIQPSLFEGWSTVIEDAMAMNQSIIASDLEVNYEQLGEKGVFFDRNDAVALAFKVQEQFMSKKKVDYNYKMKQLDFANNFISCLY